MTLEPSTQTYVGRLTFRNFADLAGNWARLPAAVRVYEPALPSHLPGEERRPDTRERRKSSLTGHKTHVLCDHTPSTTPSWLSWFPKLLISELKRWHHYFDTMGVRTNTSDAGMETAEGRERLGKKILAITAIIVVLRMCCYLNFGINVSIWATAHPPLPLRKRDFSLNLLITNNWWSWADQPSTYQRCSSFNGFYKPNFTFKFKVDVCTLRTEMVSNNFLICNTLLIHILICTYISLIELKDKPV